MGVPTRVDTTSQTTMRPRRVRRFSCVSLAAIVARQTSAFSGSSSLSLHLISTGRISGWASSR